MATVEPAPAMGTDATNAQPSNQENQDPGAPESLRSMFEEGQNKFKALKTDNLFEALEKRNLTEDEQALIQQRVEHQRKMFELFERREKERKIRELREVCPDINDDEAAAALDLCNGREEEAASALVSDPGFKRRVKAAAGTGPAAPAQPSRTGSGAASGSRANWSARPTGPRPKLIDPATLGDTVFVGTFRGKGFQGASKGARTGSGGPAEKRQNRSAGAAGSDPEAEDGSEEVEAPVETDQEEPSEAEEVKAVGSDVTPPAPPAAEPAAADPPASVPQTYTLVRETSEGEIRPVTDSELKMAVGAVPLAASPAPEEEEEEAPAPVAQPTRAPSRRVAAAAAANVSVLEKMAIRLAGMEDAAAAAWLAKMAPEMAGNALQALGVEDAMRAVTLHELVEAERAAAAAVEAEGAAAAGGNASGQESPAPRRTPRSAAKRNVAVAAAVAEEDSDHAGYDSETTLSEGGGGARAPRSASRPKRAAAVKKKSYLAEEDDDEDAEWRVGSARKGRSDGAAAPKRRKSSLDGEEAKAAAAEAIEAATAMDVDPQTAAAAPAAEPAADPAAAAEAPSSSAPVTRRAGSSSRGTGAISARGHTNRGRVKQKSHKSADLVEVGALQTRPGWHNAGYIFPEGFHSRTLFRSSVALDQLCVHECHIVGLGGKFWPAPTFQVVALDRPDEPLVAKSCTGCWTGVLKRINAEIEARRKAGEDLPPPPKTAIAGPEYFGLNQPNIQVAIEALDEEHKCAAYWNGKAEREAVAAGLPSAPSGTSARPPRAPRAATAPRIPSGGRGGRRRRGGAGSDDEGNGHASDGEHDESHYTMNRWSAVSRTDRYRKRLEESGEDISALGIDADNPVPEVIDPITLEPVVRPAISPYGHVMGAATWKAVLAENGTCPFTKQPLRWEQCRMLTQHNIEFYRDKIIR